MPPLGPRAAPVNMRFPQHMALEHAPMTPSYWQVTSQTIVTPGLPQTPQTGTTSVFELPPTPGDLVSGPQHESHLNTPYNAALMSRANSHSSGASSPNGSPYYTPTSIQDSDYFNRGIPTATGGHYSHGVAPTDFGPSGPMSGTINLSHIQDSRHAIKFRSTKSVTESEPGTPAPSIHSSPVRVKTEYPSPQSNQSSSPAVSVSSHLHSSPPRLSQSGSASARDAPSSTPELSSSRTTQSPNFRSNSVEDEDDYVTQDDGDDDDFRPISAQRKKKKKGSPRRRRNTATSTRRVVSVVRAQPADSNKLSGNLSRAAFLKRYPRLPFEFPLLYYALLPDMTLDDAAAPKIGTIPSSVTPLQKCSILQDFYGRGKRLIRQLDEFSYLVKPRTSGSRTNEPLWTEIPKPYSRALVFVRRKVVERTENYKYTRRDLLKKTIKRCCPAEDPRCIENGMIHWDRESGNNDPAGDLARRGIIMGLGMGNSSPPHPTQNINTGHHDLRPAVSRSSLRVPPSPLTIVPLTPPPSYSASSLTPESAGTHYHTVPSTPVSAVTPEGVLLPLPFSRLALSESNFLPELPAAGVNSVLPSPSALGLSQHRQASYGNVRRTHSRSYSSDSDHSSSSIE
ncbi:hypothetical protein CC85DRAFT_326482 [Cutaneotrichosporon oleaginosum]|uniref:Uncharacterized protein n=1 Tax=Cutaneotrichosporon oleaginosum TaxID=879819 RepID=A0A0J1B949_9TREE|nr:uncharacterized protein CC85DRAFT_326482 [Cutaneotrichosporon oleaginosum]KLT44334.1 hypothetical protein CC85DRAFT_326482 [Cutaneotrichosporon oleaginosum]TXT07938.1 hypothetical protein COLE_04862 [Cutaneotrichosporon oleaginosum]